MGPKDQKLNQQVKRTAVRLLKKKDRATREERRAAEPSLAQIPPGSSEESEVSQDDGGVSQDEQQQPSPARKHKKMKRLPQEITMSPDILRHPEVAGVLIRNNITPTAALATIEAIC